MTTGDAHRGCNLRARRRKAHRVGPADGNSRVARVQRELEWFVACTTVADARAQVGQQLLVRRIGVRDTRDATD